MRSSVGAPVVAGREIASGGEGRIYEVQGAPDKVLKVYHAPCDQAKQAKLIAMVKMRSAGLDAVAAWPLDLVWDQRGRCIGFIMPNVSGEGVIDRLSHPAERRQAFPEVDYLFISTVATNLMAAASTLHASGVVIGDVNESNIIVRKDGTVVFIDADSFQVSFGGSTFHCEVGKDLFTAPELQGRGFKGLTRTWNHDVFGLSVLVFQLLLHGRHPYHGRAVDGRDRQTSEAIRDGAYAYSRRGVRLAQPPPGALPIEAFGELEDLFERSFRSSGRPSARDWMGGLHRFGRSLRPCRSNKRHAVFPGRSECDLCRLARDPLPSIGGGVHGVKIETATLRDLIGLVGRLAPPPSLTDLCGEAEVSAGERQLPHAPSFVSDEEYRRFMSGSMEFGGKAAVGKFVLALLAGALGFVLPFAVCVAVPLFIGGCMGVAEMVKARGRWARLRPEVERFRVRREAADRALRDLVAVESTVQEVNSVTRMRALKDLQALQQVARALQDHPNELSRQEQTAIHRYRDDWRSDQLNGFIIRHAGISGIGAERSRVLASNGIETAADVERRAILAIPGFGAVLTNTLMSWRRDCERVVNSRAVPAMPSAYLDQVRSEHARKVNDQVASLKQSLNGYQELAQQVHLVLREHSRRVAEARRRYRQARRELQ